ncbi:hypothetical protein M422DRAFT_45658 [Sphaerobolus stellatus SS14]|uniref:Uncharacterized protein n=1 Tax=Sphaerobolus stellatus (strain SS14) TaxID=990650 RepID=A0A0C9UMU9_SPHS4|nr:hypothetical protein M422DRAFT_55351 [Sphaerobolus stellatus SS14]KIJ47633.1 hypothetical protein M422DRAFT_45658 [Sphaerobolus stellatus SS14]
MAETSAHPPRTTDSSPVTKRCVYPSVYITCYLKNKTAQQVFPLVNLTLQNNPSRSSTPSHPNFFDVVLHQVLSLQPTPPDAFSPPSSTLIPLYPSLFDCTSQCASPQVSMPSSQRKCPASTAASSDADVVCEIPSSQLTDGEADMAEEPVRKKRKTIKTTSKEKESFLAKYDITKFSNVEIRGMCSFYERSLLLTSSSRFATQTMEG